VATAKELDRYTRQTIFDFGNGYVAFAGQRDDGFYADIQSIFDILSLRDPGEDSQGGFNIHMLVLRIPVSDIGGDRQIAGVHATTSRWQTTILERRGEEPTVEGPWIQVGRQDNPLFCEGFVGIEDAVLSDLRDDPAGHRGVRPR